MLHFDFNVGLVWPFSLLHSEWSNVLALVGGFKAHNRDRPRHFPPGGCTAGTQSTRRCKPARAENADSNAVYLCECRLGGYWLPPASPSLECQTGRLILSPAVPFLTWTVRPPCHAKNKTGTPTIWTCSARGPSAR